MKRLFPREYRLFWLFVNRYINSFSKVAAAGISTAMKIDRFAGMTSQSVGLAIPTFISLKQKAQSAKLYSLVVP